MADPPSIQPPTAGEPAETVNAVSDEAGEARSPTLTPGSKLAELLKSGHIHVSIATGLSIIVMAYASKRFLPEPLSYLQLAAPPFLMTMYEAMVSKKKDARYLKSRYWVLAIILATLAVMGTQYL